MDVDKAARQERQDGHETPNSEGPEPKRKSGFPRPKTSAKNKKGRTISAEGKELN